jgi:hypothetical protein
MALPSAVTIGSLALIVAAGAGLGGVVASSSGHEDHSDKRTATASHKNAPTTDELTRDDQTQQPRHRRTPEPVPKTLIDIFNNSGIPDLAARRATFLAGAGWNVAATDNWYGDIPADTVYYGPRMRDDAVQLAKALHVERLHHAVAPMQFDRLTVILTDR